MRTQRLVYAGLAALLLTLAGVAPALAADCAKLATLALPGVKITKADMTAAGAFEPPPSPFPPPAGLPPASYKAMPAFCRVTATLTPTPDSDIRIEVWLPAANWNGKFVGVGNGVWAGTIGYFAMADPLSRGYAVAATDTGHVGNGMDAGFAIGHPEKLIDFGYRAVHAMTVAAKAVVAAYYGKGPRLSFWVSCSTGGRQGLMEAYRYPDDYNAISAMAPANPMTALMVQTIWTGFAAQKTPANALTPAKLMAVHKAHIAACDAKDGVTDGLVSDPERCSFDPKLAQCADRDGPDCLTAAQVETMRAVYDGVKNPRTGERIFAGFEPGSETQIGLLMMGPEPFPVATSYMRDLVFQDAKWDFRSFDYDRDTAKARAVGSSILDVPPSGLKTFFARGGKLLLSHGWSDGLIPARNTLAFYRAMTRDAAPGADSVRLFMVPAMCHCGGGDGPFLFDALGTVDAWGDGGKAPERIVVRRPPGAPAIARPVCSWPRIAKYSGKGSSDDDANFHCGMP
jgi:hypothetical protein